MSLLEFSRVGKKGDSVTEIPITDAVEDLVDLLGIPQSFSVDVQKNLPTIVSPKPAFETVVRNLISNAVKHHNREDGNIQVRLEDEPETVILEVSDDGPGIPDEFHEKIFGIFQTLTPRDDKEASGMGLAIVKKTVQSVGGEIWLTSKQGEGTKFFVRWPKTYTESDT